MPTSNATNDLTVIFLTANEHPKHWEAYHREKLLEAIGDFPLITVSRKPMGGINILDGEPQSHYNMYCQLLKAARIANTPYIATAESDTLYPKEHFTFYRPPDDAVAYDMTRWMLFTWKPQMFSLRKRISNCTLIAPRQYLIDALSERYEGKEPFVDRVGEVGRHIHEKALGVKLRNAQEVWCHYPTVQVNHPNGTNYKLTDHPTRKNPGEVKAYEIPVWGRAEDLAKEYR